MVQTKTVGSKAVKKVTLVRHIWSKKDHQIDQAITWSPNGHKLGYTGYGKGNKLKAKTNISSLVAYPKLLHKVGQKQLAPSDL